MPDVLIIANPSAGRGRSAPLHVAVTVLRNAGDDVVVTTTSHAGQATEIARAAVDDGVRRIVAAGGDGTVHEVVNGLVDVEAGAARAEGIVLGLLSTGSGSDFARTFGLDRRPELAARHLLATHRMPIDIGRVRCIGPDGQPLVRAFANIADIGWAADVTARANRLPRFVGAARYVLAAVGAARSMRPVPVRVELDHTTREDEVCEIVVANGQFFGGGLKVAPRALPDDGLLNVQTWATGPVDVLRELPRVRVGEHLERADVREWQSRRVVVDPAGAPLAIEADGEPLGTTPATIDLLPGVLSLAL